MKNNKRPLRFNLYWRPTKNRFCKFSIVYVDFIKKFKKQNELNDDCN